MSKRLLGFRKQVACNPALLRYPFSVLATDPEYSLEEITASMPHQEETPEPTNFPESICEYIWLHASDGQVWYALARLENGNYAFFEAKSDASGFNCKGSMRLYVSDSRPYLIQFALSETAYQQYLKDTTYYKKIEDFEGINDCDDDESVVGFSASQ